MFRVIALLALTSTAALAAENAMPSYDVAGFCKDARDQKKCLTTQYDYRSSTVLRWNRLSPAARSECIANVGKFNDYAVLYTCANGLAE